MTLNNVIHRIFRTTATAGMCLGLAIAALAAQKPLNEPNGLAVDSHGNLYVANSGGNNVLVYNSKYRQMTADTITQGIVHPTGVALDPQGNLWVAVYIQGGGSITEYTAGKQVTDATITEGVSSPLAIAVDGSGNIFVQNDNSYVDVYSQPVLGVGSPALVQTFNLPGPLYAVSVWENTVLLGAPTTFGVAIGNSLKTIETGVFQGETNTTNNSGLSIAPDHKGGFFMGNLDGSVNYFQASGESFFTQLSYEPAGAAVDTVNDRVYFSCFQCNYIQAYSITTGELLETIQ